jgi:hypothetical protein
MSAAESIIWGKFLAKFGKEYQRFDYDLRIGNGITPEQDLPFEFKKDYEDLTKSRIDAVGYVNKTATIFEVKQRANLASIGQLLGYHILFNKSFPQFSVDDLILVCESATLEIQQVIEKNGIQILILT